MPRWERGWEHRDPSWEEVFGGGNATCTPRDPSGGEYNKSLINYVERSDGRVATWTTHPALDGTVTHPALLAADMVQALEARKASGSRAIPS